MKEIEIHATTKIRIITLEQEWLESEDSKTGWDSQGWLFEGVVLSGGEFNLIEVIETDKHGNPTKALFAKIETTVL